MDIIYIIKCLKSTSLNINLTETNTITEQTTANLPTITTTAGKELYESNIEIICLGKF